MIEIRLAQQGETAPQKDLWQRCFGDPERYIDFYYANRYQEAETAVLLHNGEILAMLTMIPVKTLTSDERAFKTAMLYAIATHPEFRNRGFATQLMDFSNQYLKEMNFDYSVLVPAQKQLFDYYRKRGYREGFQIREALLTRSEINGLSCRTSLRCTILPANPNEYNRIRNEQLNGRLFIAYTNEDIAYQKLLSQQSGEDIYLVDIEGKQGCLAVERISPGKLFIKEIMLPDEYINVAIRQIALQLPAMDYVLRTPPFLAEQLGGSIRPFAMIRGLRESVWPITNEELGYLGFAFD